MSNGVTYYNARPTGACGTELQPSFFFNFLREQVKLKERDEIIRIVIENIYM